MARPCPLGNAVLSHRYIIKCSQGLWNCHSSASSVCADNKSPSPWSPSPTTLSKHTLTITCAKITKVQRWWWAHWNNILVTINQGCLICLVVLVKRPLKVSFCFISQKDKDHSFKISVQLKLCIPTASCVTTEQRALPSTDKLSISGSRITVYVRLEGNGKNLSDCRTAALRWSTWG